MNKIPEDKKVEAYRLHTEEKLSYSQIADRLGMKYSTVGAEILARKKGFSSNAEYQRHYLITPRNKEIDEKQTESDNHPIIKRGGRPRGVYGGLRLNVDQAKRLKRLIHGRFGTYINLIGAMKKTYGDRVTGIYPKSKICRRYVEKLINAPGNPLRSTERQTMSPSFAEALYYLLGQEEEIDFLREYVRRANQVELIPLNVAGIEKLKDIHNRIIYRDYKSALDKQYIRLENVFREKIVRDLEVLVLKYEVVGISPDTLDSQNVT